MEIFSKKFAEINEEDIKNLAMSFSKKVYLH